MVRKVFARWNRWLKTHRRSRKQAALQNLLFSAALIVLICIMVPQLWERQEVTVEEVVEQWCREQMFGTAEIVSIQCFQESSTDYMDVIISKTTLSGEHYDARLYLKQEKPWKWNSVGWDYGYISVEDWVEELLEESDPISAFTEFNIAESSHVEVQEDGSGEAELVTVSVHFAEMPGYEEDCADTTFQVNLKTGEAALLQQGIHYAQRYGDSQLERIETWLTEPRMVQIAQVLVEEMK